MAIINAPVYQGEVLSRDRIQNFIPNVWLGDVLRYRDQNLHMTKCCDMRTFIGQKGDTLHIPLVGRAAVYDRIPGQPVNLQARTPGKFTMVVDKDKESSFGIDDIVEVQSQYNTRTEYTREASYALARDLDNAALALRAAVPAAQQIFSSSTGLVGGNAEPIDEAVILSAWQRMAQADVPIGECVWMFGINQVMDLLIVDRFTSKDYAIAQLQAGGMTNGMVGTIHGLPVYVSTQIGNNSLTGYRNGEGADLEPTPGVTGSPYLPTQDTWTSLPLGTTGSETTLPFMTGGLFHPQWAIVAKQMNIKVEASRETLLQMDALVTRHVYGAKKFRNDHAVLIHSLGTV